MIEKMQQEGYKSDAAEARICQDIVLKAISESPLSDNVTIKGGVVMRSITNDIRRATQDMDIEQEEYCFDIAFDDKGASLLINTREQMFTEKLRSLLKFGTFSTRYKDIYDMYYQCGKMNESKLFQCIKILIFDDPGMKENNMSDIVNRIEKVFTDTSFKNKVDKSDKRWLDDDISVVFETILKFICEF